MKERAESLCVIAAAAAVVVGAAADLDAVPDSNCHYHLVASRLS
jgi:hypothetical protein